MLPAFNPCCGVKLKTAIITIGIVDIVYGILFLGFGVFLFLSKETPKVFKHELELINLLARPALKMVFGVILYLAAKFHMKNGGIVSMVGCISWLVCQLGLLVVTFVRIKIFFESRVLGKLLHKSGATTMESFAILGSICPFLTIGVLCYEMVSVIFFIMKISNDRVILNATALALKAAQDEFQKSSQMSISPGGAARPMNNQKTPPTKGKKGGA